MSFRCFIGIGICSKYFLLILGACIFKFLKQSLFNFFQINPLSETGLFGFMPILYGHFVISSIFTYISYIIFGLLFFYISKKTTKKSIKQEEEKDEITIKKASLLTFSNALNSIQDKLQKTITFQKILKCIGPCLVFVLHTDFSKIMYLYDFSLFNIWTFYIVFILLFMKKFFVIEIFRHQKYSMFFVIVVCSILLILSTFFPYNEMSDLNSYQKVNEITGSYLMFIPILIIFILLTCMTSFYIVYMKAIMEIDMLPPYILILITGIIGLILNVLLLAFTSSFKCTMDNFLKNICIVFSEEGSYYDNLLIFFKKLKEIYEDDKKKEFFLEIFLVYPLYIIFSFLEYVCQIFSIYYLNPNYILIKDPIYYGTIRMVFLFYNINNLSPFMYLSQFLLLELAEIFGLLGYLVYLEILELKFCGLDKNLKRRICSRNEKETLISINELSLINEGNYDIQRSDSFASMN